MKDLARIELNELIKNKSSNEKKLKYFYFQMMMQTKMQL